MSHAGPIHVLHVDDEPDLAETAAVFLEREDDRISVRTATTPTAGLERLADDQIDCVVSDYDMPGQNGIEFLEAVREEYSELPFILYTGKGSEEIASEAISAGVSEYLQKGSGTSQYTVLANRVRNVVDQYRSQQAIKDTERKLAELAERTDDILFMFDGDWNELLFINSAYEEVWGESIEELEANPESFLDNVHPEDKQRARASMEALSQGVESHIKYRIIRQDGERRWIRANSQPVVDDDGAVVRIVGRVSDVTGEKERELQLETIIDNLPGYVYRHGYDEEYPLKFVKGDAETITGYTATELEDDIGIAEEIIHPDDREDLWNEHIAGLDETGSFDSVYRIITKDGDVRWVRDQGQLVEDTVTDESVIDGFITDLSDRILREDAHRVQQKFITESLDALQDIYYAVTADGELVRWNKRVPEVTGYTAEELEQIDVLEFFAEEHRDRITEAIETAIEEGTSIVQADMRTADGGRRAFEFRGTRLTSPSSEGPIVVGVGRDVSEQIARERRLAEQNDQLDQFASVASHDLRNPLNVAEGHLELARSECDSDHLDVVSKAHGRMDDLIDDLLTLAREGKEIGKSEPIDLGTFVPQCWENVDTPEATLAVEAGRTVQADRSRLKQLIENLMRNAIEHNSGAVTVTVGGLDDGFYVEDDGVGIPAADREEVFKTGFSTSDDGTGFGLAIVERIAHAHGWEVLVTDGSEGGVRFEIRGVGPDVE
jgi:PAS domain S-box-containing protein